MKLYAVKSGERYLKYSGDNVELVGMEKASVYPSEEAAKALLESAQKAGFTNVHIVVLTITETEL